MEVQANQERLHSSGTRHFLVLVDDILWDKSMHATEALLVTGERVDLKLNAEKTKQMCVCVCFM
jgi:hypothetical protein